MSFDPNIILKDNYNFILNNKSTDLGHIDVANDGHLVKVTWLKWVVRWIVNLLWKDSVDQKVYSVFCAAIKDKFPNELQPPMATLKNLANRVHYIDSLPVEADDVNSDEGSDGENDIEVAPDDAAQVNDEPELNLDLADMEKILAQKGVTLESKEEGNVKRFYDVLVEFTKSNSFETVLAKAFEILNSKNSPILISRPHLRNTLLRNLESKIEADLSFFNLLHEDTQTVVEGFKNGLEEQNRQKLEEARKALEEEARIKADAEAEAKMKEEAEAKIKAEENRLKAEENGYIVENALIDLKALIESNEKIDCSRMISMLEEAWEQIQHYPKDIGIPESIAEVFPGIVNDLPGHILNLNRNEHPVKLLEDSWNKIVDHLGVDAPLEIDETAAKANSPIRQFAEEYLQTKLQAEYGLDAAILNANLTKMEKIVERVVLNTDSTDPLDILREIAQAIDFLIIDMDDFILKYVE